MKRLLISILLAADFVAALPTRVGLVARSDLLQQVTVAGNVVPNRRTVVTPPYNSYIKRIFVKIGDSVKKGDPVVSLAQSLRGAREEIYPLRAPFAGTVVQVLKAEGEYVVEAAKDENAILRIDDLERLFVYCEVAESEITKVKKGQEAIIKANAVLTRPYHGIVREISLAAKEQKGGWTRPGDRVGFEVRIEIGDKNADIRPGMSAIVDIVIDKRNQTLVLPHEFVEKQGDEYSVTLENGDKKKIEVGLKNQDSFEILKGLKENDKVRMVDFQSSKQES